MFFSVMTKNLNWEISTKNLDTFKRWDGDGVNDEKFQYYGSSLKDPIFNRGEVHEKTFFLWGVNRLKRGGLDNLKI